MEQVEILRAACCIAGLDKVNDVEHSVLQRIATHAGVGGASLDAMIHRAENDPNYRNELLSLATSDVDQTFKVLLSIAMADGKLSDQEQDLLFNFAEKLNISRARFDELMLVARKRLPD